MAPDDSGMTLVAIIAMLTTSATTLILAFQLATALRLTLPPRRGQEPTPGEHAAAYRAAVDAFEHTATGDIGGPAGGGGAFGYRQQPRTS